MKQISYYFSVVAIMCILATKSFAYDIAVENEDGVTICYSYINDGEELAVVKAESPYSYTNDVIFNIPQSVMIDGVEYPVTRIDDEAFKNSTVVMLELPEGIKSIGESAFYSCKNLISVKIPDSVEGEISKSCFWGCEMLQSVIIGENITQIGFYAFAGCSKLEKIYLPDKVTTIHTNSFNGCNNLTSISFGKGISSFSYNSNYQSWACSSLSKIIIRDISAWCRVSNLKECSPLKDRYIYTDEDTPMKDLIIPNDVTRITEYAFTSCKGIETITVPNSVQIIEEAAFYMCNPRKIILGNSLQDIAQKHGMNGSDTVICYRSVPPTLNGGTFTNNSTILFVPKGCVNSYKATKWGGFMKIMELSSVTLDKHRIKVSAGKTEQITATVYPSNESEHPIVWQSSNEDIVSVDENGLVKAHKAGKATITVTLKTYIDAVDKCEVEVTQPVEGITLNETSIIMEEFGNMVKLNATILPEEAYDKSVRWSSSNPNVCTVTQNGTVVAVGNGTATVIATTVDGDIPATCVVNVKDYVYDTNRDGAIDVADIAAIISKMAAMARSQKQTEE